MAEPCKSCGIPEGRLHSRRCLMMNNEKLRKENAFLVRKIAKLEKSSLIKEINSCQADKGPHYADTCPSCLVNKTKLSELNKKKS